MLTIQNLTKTYSGGKVAVDHLSLHVSPGEIFGFIGHNGAGKTTTLKAVSGVMAFDSGDIIVDGRSILTDPIGAKSVMAFLPDNPDLYEFYTGIKFLTFIADMFGIPKEERTERIGYYSDAFGMTGVLGSSISGYSHGMKQKLALISALIRKPRLLILDEPFVGLDPSAAHLLKTMLRELCDNGGSVFFSTHVLEVAQKLCDHVAILRNGKLVTEGRMEDIVGDSSLEDVFLELTEQEENA